MADEKNIKPVSYPRGMKNEEPAGKAESVMFRGMVFDDHERISSNEFWSQVCEHCVKDRGFDRLVNGVTELPEDCKEDLFECGITDCSQPAQYYIELPYEEMCPETVEKPEPRYVINEDLEMVKAELNEILKEHDLEVVITKKE